MSPDMIYFMKVNAAILFFYAFYRLFFYNDTFFRLRRTTLIGLLLVAVVYPLPDFSGWMKEINTVTEAATVYSTMLPEVIVSAGKTTAATPDGWLLQSAFLLYLAGVAVLGIRFAVQLGSILILSVQCKTARINGVYVHLLNHPAGPFSFFHLIFIHLPSHTEQEVDEILTHEMTHVRQWHSLDVILSELLCTLFWVNPFVWLLKREVRQNLEYLADQTVLLSGHDRKSYQFHLLGLANQKAAANLYNSFNVLPLKNRIRMMNKKRSHQIGRTKYLLFAPLAALLLMVNNLETVARVTTLPSDIQPTDSVMPEVVVVGYGSADAKPAVPANDNQKKTVQKNEPKIMKDTPPREYNGEKVFTKVDQMPSFPGGDAALLQYIARSIKYPVESQKAGNQGRVIASFTVDKEGNIAQLELVRGIEPLLDAEALRVLSLMPKWTPGVHKGKVVNVRYTVPITFRLQ
ncbi:TonB family protein [Macellibacteroides fermentans]|uniref:TonB family protein n=1 Tax=Macellibacteroides fermentans TaxID=879969 RepID=UPI00406C9E36